MHLRAASRWAMCAVYPLAGLYTSDLTYAQAILASIDMAHVTHIFVSHAGC
jgi:hypothetical protein